MVEHVDVDDGVSGGNCELGLMASCCANGCSVQNVNGDGYDSAASRTHQRPPMAHVFDVGGKSSFYDGEKRDRCIAR